MSRLSKFSAKLFFTLALFSQIILFSQAACTAPQRDAAGNMVAAVSDGIDASLENAPELVFSGQVEDENGRWLNDYVVLLFQDGKEVARTTSHLLDAPLSGQGPMDGVFELRVRNEYALTEMHKFYDHDDNIMVMQPVSGVVGKRYIGTWFERLNPKDMRIISIPNKQLKFTIVVLDYTKETLPQSYYRGNLSLSEGGVLMTNMEDAVSDGQVAVLATAVPTQQPAIQSNVQFTVLQNSNSSTAWNMQMTGYYGNRWDVWQRFISGHVSGITWEYFKESVLVHNPELESDGFVFYPDKTYRLPLNQ